MLKRVLIKSILILIRLIELIQYRNKIFKDSDPQEYKIIGAVPLEGISIMTDTGWAPLSCMFETKPMFKYDLKLENGMELSGADHHPLFKPDKTLVMLSELNPGNEIITQAGNSKVVYVKSTRYKVSMLDFSVTHPNRRAYTNGILSHNTITTATYIVWYILFNKEKNVLMVADVMDTTKELIDKMKNIILNLPFFMKPGLVINNVMMLKFDNGSRVIGRTTTKKTGIGFNIHLLYMDEFAHIDASFLSFFYRSIYPTVSAMTNSKVIITSTPNGVNRFYRLWMDAIDKKNTYVPMRVDWWQVPGRDEQWRLDTIANLGSEEDFNQEYGLQFFSGDTLLMSSHELKRMNKSKTTYEAFRTSALDFNETDFSQYFKFHPNFIQKNLVGNVDLKHDKSYYVLSVDTGDGIGRDYSVVNIYKAIALPIEVLKRHRTFIKNDQDVVGLLQVGLFRSNNVNIDAFCEIVKSIVFKFFNPAYVRIVIELNHKGERVHDKLKTHGDYWSGMVVYSRHKDGDKYMAPGIILANEKVKDRFCEDFRYYTVIERVIPNEFFTVEEISGLGKTKINGSYRSQSGNDDCAISSVNMSAFFKSPQFYDVADDVVAAITDETYIMTVREQFIDYNMRMDAKDTGLEPGYIANLNSMMG